VYMHSKLVGMRVRWVTTDSDHPWDCEVISVIKELEFYYYQVKLECGQVIHINPDDISWFEIKGTVKQSQVISLVRKKKKNN